MDNHDNEISTDQSVSSSVSIIVPAYTKYIGYFTGWNEQCTYDV